MNLVRLTKTILICTVVLAGAISLTACSNGKKPVNSTPAPSTEMSTGAVIVTATPTPSIAEITGSIAANDTPVTWTETVMPDTVMYVKLKDGFLKVRKGPGTDYAQVAALTDGMPVTVIGTAVMTDTTWYRLKDGFYVSGDYLTATAPTA